VSKQLIKNIFNFFGINIQRNNHLPELWTQSADFIKLYAQVKDRTVVSKERHFMLYQLAKYANTKKGDIAEVGVYRGGTGKLIAMACPDKKVHLFDTFSGMPKVNPSIDDHVEGEFSDTSLKSVQAFLTDCGNVTFHPGLFPRTAQSIRDRRFCLVNVDADIYQSIKDCLTFFYDRLIPGGIMLFDDYEWWRTPGVKKAIDEFLSNKPEVPIVTVRYQCMLIKV